MSGAAEPSLCGFVAVHVIAVFADDSRVCFIQLEKLLVPQGGTTQGLLFFFFFSFLSFVCPQDDGAR